MFSPAARYGPFTRYEASGSGEGLAGSRLARTPVRKRKVLKEKKQPWKVCPPFSAVRVKLPGAQVTGVPEQDVFNAMPRISFFSRVVLCGSRQPCSHGK